MSNQTNNQNDTIKNSKLELFEPAMCCETGLCGVGVDTNLLKVAAVLENLKKQGVQIIRYNLKSKPIAFISNTDVNKLLNNDNDILPITIIDGKVMLTKRYPTENELYEWLGIEIAKEIKQNENNCGCCCGNNADTKGKKGCC